MGKTYVTVADLIDRLRACDPAAVVYVEDAEGAYGPDFAGLAAPPLAAVTPAGVPVVVLAADRPEKYTPGYLAKLDAPADYAPGSPAPG